MDNTIHTMTPPTAHTFRPHDYTTSLYSSTHLRDPHIYKAHLIHRKRKDHNTTSTTKDDEVEHEDEDNGGDDSDDEAAVNNDNVDVAEEGS